MVLKEIRICDRMDIKKFRVLLGNCLINTPMCMMYIFGNIYPYVYSYFRFRLNSNLDNDLNPTWMFPLFFIFQSIGVLSADFIKHRFGLVQGTLFGVLLNLVYLFLMYFAMKQSVWLTCICFLMGGGYGSGLLMAINLAHVTVWYQDNAGQATAAVLAAAGVGSIILNMVITGYVNPNNLQTDVVEDGLTFFSQIQVVHRVPMVWVLIGAVSCGFQFLGIFLIGFRIEDQPKESGSHISRREKEVYEEKTVLCNGETDQIYDNTEINDNMITANKHHKHVSNGTPLLPKENSTVYPKRTQNGPSTCPGEKRESPSCSSSTPKSSDTSGRVWVKIFTESMSSPSFHVLWISNAVLTFAHLLTFNYYKTFGQFWIKDDQFLALTGSVTAVSIFVAVLGLGKLVDRTGIKNTLLGVLSVISFMMAWWYFTAMFNRWVYFLWSNIMMGLIAAHVLLMSMAALKLYGESHYIFIFGLLQTASLLGNLIFPFIFTFLITSLGWFWIFLISAAATSMSCFLTATLLQRGS